MIDDLSPVSPTSPAFRRWPGSHVQRLIRYNRRNPIVRLAAAAAEKFLRAYRNEGVYDFEHDGEKFLLENYADWCGGRPKVVWDVGANAGQWAAMVRSMLQNAVVHSFEVVPSIADQYQALLGHEDWAFLHRLGLSESAGEVEVKWHRSSDQESSINLRKVADTSAEIETVVCPVSTIDLQIAAGLPAPSFLKIDTEGHEGPVLRGAHELLHGTDAPELIQFEYGSTWIPARETLERMHDLLTGARYSIGRLYPRHVEFRAYTYADDDFQMGNIIACRDPALTAILAG